MSNALRTAVFTMTFLGLVSCLELFSSSSAEEKKDAEITSVTTTKTNATIEGVGGGDWEVVLRIGKDNAAKPLDSVSSHKDQRPFTATVAYGKIVPKGNNQFGEGIVYKIDYQTAGSTTNIGFEKDHPRLSGTARFRSGKDNKSGKLPIEQDGLKVTIADLVHEDGSTEPVTVFLRPR
jgi:hypothetical protein